MPFAKSPASLVQERKPRDDGLPPSGTLAKVRLWQERGPRRYRVFLTPSVHSKRKGWKREAADNYVPWAGAAQVGFAQEVPMLGLPFLAQWQREASGLYTRQLLCQVPPPQLSIWSALLRWQTCPGCPESHGQTRLLQCPPPGAISFCLTVLCLFPQAGDAGAASTQRPGG